MPTNKPNLPPEKIADNTVNEVQKETKRSVTAYNEQIISGGALLSSSKTTAAVLGSFDSRIIKLPTIFDDKTNKEYKNLYVGLATSVKPAKKYQEYLEFYYKEIHKIFRLGLLLPVKKLPIAIKKLEEIKDKISKELSSSTNNQSQNKAKTDISKFLVNEADRLIKILENRNAKLTAESEAVEKIPIVRFFYKIGVASTPTEYLEAFKSAVPFKKTTFGKKITSAFDNIIDAVESSSSTNSDILGDDIEDDTITGPSIPSGGSAPPSPPSPSGGSAPPSPPSPSGGSAPPLATKNKKSSSSDLNAVVEQLNTTTGAITDLTTQIANVFKTPLIDTAALGAVISTSITENNKNLAETIISGVRGVINDLPQRFDGGPVDALQPYIVGEKGPELFLSKSQGTIIPLNKKESTVESPSIVKILNYHSKLLEQIYGIENKQLGIEENTLTVEKEQLQVSQQQIDEQQLAAKEAEEETPDYVKPQEETLAQTLIELLTNEAVKSNMLVGGTGTGGGTGGGTSGGTSGGNNGGDTGGGFFDTASTTYTLASGARDLYRLGQKGRQVFRIPGSPSILSRASSLKNVAKLARGVKNPYALAGMVGLAGLTYSLSSGTNTESKEPESPSKFTPTNEDVSQYFEFSSKSGNQEHFEKLDPEVKKRAIIAAKEYQAKTGKKLEINSAYRSQEEQNALLEEAERAGRPGRTASGHPIAKESRHKHGQALDIQNYNDPEALEALKNAGFTQNVGGDAPHFELSSTRVPETALETPLSPSENKTAEDVKMPSASDAMLNFGIGASGKLLGAKTLGKTLGKRIPGVGLAVGAGLGLMRAMEGDYLGAMGEVASGALGPAGIIIDAMLAKRDYDKDVAAAKSSMENSESFKVSVSSPSTRPSSESLQDTQSEGRRVITDQLASATSRTQAPTIVDASTHYHNSSQVNQMQGAMNSAPLTVENPESVLRRALSHA